MEHSFVVAVFIIFVTLITVNNGADSDEIDSNFHSNEDSFATMMFNGPHLHYIVMHRIVLPFLRQNYHRYYHMLYRKQELDQSSVNPTNHIQFRKGRHLSGKTTGKRRVKQQIYAGCCNYGSQSYSSKYGRRRINQNIYAGCCNYGDQNIELQGNGNGGRESKCPYEFTRFGDMCYYLSNERASWEEASNYCRKMDAELVSITTETQWKSVKAFIATKRPAAYNEPVCPILTEQYTKNVFRVWTSANDIEREGNFIWKGRNFEMKNGYTHWCPGEPNNEFFTKSPGENCMEIWFNTVNSASSCWNDLHCDIFCKIQYLCEKRL